MDTLVPPQRHAAVVDIDYSLSLAQMIERGQFDWIEDLPAAAWDREHSALCTLSRPQHLEPQVRLEPWTFSHTVDVDRVIREMAEANARPARIEELLAFAAQFPDREPTSVDAMLALGSIYTDRHERRYTPYVRTVGTLRYLGLEWCDAGWSPGYRFACIRIA